jgi:tRNA nucleotidyltransferase/poly(A) polymerase
MMDPARVERLFQLLRHRPVVATLVQACREAGGVEAHLVGGLLRDRLLGLASRDYDAVVAGQGELIAGRVAERLDAHLVPLGGKDFAAFRVVGAGGDDWVLDVWDREDTSLEADMARRDFTVNSFALALATEAPPEGRLFDPFGGVADISRRVLRATTGDSFAGDPLRVLRLPRLLTQLPGFGAEPATLELARQASPGLARVAAERVREELVLLLQRRGSHRAFGLLTVLAVYPGLWRGEPGVAATPAGERRAARALLELERFGSRLRQVQALAADAPAVDRLATRYAVTFVHLQRPEGDEAEQTATAVAAVDRFRDAGYMTRHLAERVRRLVRDAGLPAATAERRRWLHRLGDLWPSAAVLAGSRLSDDDPALADWQSAVRTLNALLTADAHRILDPPRLLTGEEVQTLLKVAPGPRVGEALGAVQQAQVDGEIATRQEAEALLKRRFS